MDKSSPAVDAIDRLCDEVRSKGGILAPIKASLLVQARSRVIQAEIQAAQDERDKLRAAIERLKDEGLLIERSRGCDVMEGK